MRDIQERAPHRHDIAKQHLWGTSEAGGTSNRTTSEAWRPSPLVRAEAASKSESEKMLEMIELGLPPRSAPPPGYLSRRELWAQGLGPSNRTASCVCFTTQLWVQGQGLNKKLLMIDPFTFSPSFICFFPWSDKGPLTIPSVSLTLYP